ncbi:hypothetical protein Tco_1072349 [Tanacetum coccineum]
MRALAKYTQGFSRADTTEICKRAYKYTIRESTEKMERCALGNLRLEEGVMFVQRNRRPLLLTLSFTAGVMFHEIVPLPGTGERYTDVFGSGSGDGN